MSNERKSRNCKFTSSESTEGQNPEYNAIDTPPDDTAQSCSTKLILIIIIMIIIIIIMIIIMILIFTYEKGVTVDVS